MCGGRNKLLQHPVIFKINQISFDVSVYFSLGTLFANKVKIRIWRLLKTKSNRKKQTKLPNFNDFEIGWVGLSSTDSARKHSALKQNQNKSQKYFWILEILFQNHFQRWRMYNFDIRTFRLFDLWILHFSNPSRGPNLLICGQNELDWSEQRNGKNRTNCTFYRIWRG